MPALKSIFIASMGMFTLASAKELKPFVKQLSEVVDFDINALNRSHPMQAITVPSTSNNKGNSIEKRDFVDCMIPSDAAVPEDCRQLCDLIDDWLWIPSLEIRGWTFGTCAYGIANLNPCASVDMPYETTKAYCNEMLQQCVVNGYDGWAQDDLQMAYALTGIESPPAYPEPSPCENK